MQRFWLNVIFLIFLKAFINCEDIANSKVLNALNANILNASDPCDNFWLYACGNWRSSPEQNNMDTFTLLGNNYALKLQNLLQNIEGKSALWHKLKEYLDSCEQAQKQTISAELYMKELPELTQNWLHTIALLRQLGLNNIFLQERVDVSNFDATLQIVEISMPNIAQSFESKQEIMSYLQYIQADVDVEVAVKVFALELSLKTLINKQLNLQSTERMLNLAELKTYLYMFDWQLYFDTLLAQPAPQQLLIRLNDAQYIKEMLDLLNQTPRNIVNAYILSKLSRYIEQVQPSLSKFSCLKHMLVMWPLGLDYIYDRYLYETRHEDEIILGNILGNLKTQFALNLLHLPLNAKQLNFMQNKLEFMRIKVGNLPLANIEYFENYYAGTYINISNFYQNHWQMLRFRTLQQHAPLLLGMQQTRVPLHTYVVNDDIEQARDAPYYVHTRNLLIVPMMFLQLPFYHHLLHPLLHYSVVGWMLAHELQHAFDTDGILLNAQGLPSRVGDSIRNTVHYQAGVDCLTDQLPPPVALSERMADVNGLQLAFQTYFERVAKSTFTINNRQYSNKQLFFLNMAQIFCGELPQPIQHDRDDVRVIISTANAVEFAAAFQCPQGTREHALHSCHMWN